MHIRDLVAGLPAWRAVLAGKPAAGDETATIMLPADAIAAADLQQRVQKMASDAWSSLTAVETRPPEPAAVHWHVVSPADQPQRVMAGTDGTDSLARAILNPHID